MSVTHLSVGSHAGMIAPLCATAPMSTSLAMRQGEAASKRKSTGRIKWLGPIKGNRIFRSANAIHHRVGGLPTLRCGCGLLRTQHAQGSHSYAIRIHIGAVDIREKQRRGQKGASRKNNEAAEGAADKEHAV